MHIDFELITNREEEKEVLDDLKDRVPDLETMSFPPYPFYLIYCIGSDRDGDAIIAYDTIVERELTFRRER